MIGFSAEMFPVFATLLMILKSVSRCHCHIVKQPQNVCREFAKQETYPVDSPGRFSGIRYSVYLGFKEKQISVSFFFTAIFDKILAYHANRLFEFRLVQSQIATKGPVANSPYFLLELIRNIPAGVKHHPVGTICTPKFCSSNLFFLLMVCVLSFMFSQYCMAKTFA